MKTATHRVTLDIHNPVSQQTLYCKKFDTARQIVFFLRENGLPYTIEEGSTASFSARKPDGNIILNECTVKGSTVTYRFTEQTASASGEAECELKLYDSARNLITSPRFTLVIEDTVYSDGDVVDSSSEFSTLVGLVAEATDAVTAANDAAENASAQANSAASVAADASAAVATANELSSVIEDRIDTLEEDFLFVGRKKYAITDCAVTAETTLITSLGTAFPEIASSGTMFVRVLPTYEDAPFGYTIILKAMIGGVLGEYTLEPNVPISIPFEGTIAAIEYSADQTVSGPMYTLEIYYPIDAGIPKDGEDGKSAYEYAQYGGYTGSEAEFAAMLAGKKSESSIALSESVAVLSNGYYFLVSALDPSKTYALGIISTSDITCNVQAGTNGGASYMVDTVATDVSFSAGVEKIIYDYTPSGDYKYIRLSVADTGAVINVYVQDYIGTEAEKVSAKVQAVRNADTLVLSAMSDFHVWTGSDAETQKATRASLALAAQGLTEMKRRIAVDCDLRLGDYTWGASDFTAAQCMTDMTTVKKSFDRDSTAEIWCVGNHDTNYGASRDRTLTSDELYAYIGANSSEFVRDPDNLAGCYGYRDFESQRIRVIALNTCDTDGERTVTEGESAPCEWMSYRQINWLVENALDFSDKKDPAAWGIVLVSHHPINYTNASVRFIKILEAYVSGASVTLNHYTDSETKILSYDFSGVVPANVLCAIGGHSHNFRTAYVSSGDDIEPWLLRISVPNICACRENEAATNASETFAEKYGEFDEDGDPVYYEKTPGTAQGTSFYIVSIDKRNKKVYAHCFGAGHDIECAITSYVPSVSYTNMIPLSTSEMNGTEIYGGKGWKEDTRMNSSAEIVSAAGMCLSGIIPVTPGDTVRIKNITVSGDSSAYLGVYNESGTAGVNPISEIGVPDDNGVYTYTPGEHVYGIRLSVGVIDETSIVTVNEEIV